MGSKVSFMSIQSILQALRIKPPMKEIIDKATHSNLWNPYDFKQLGENLLQLHHLNCKRMMQMSTTLITLLPTFIKGVANIKYHKSLHLLLIYMNQL